MFQDIFKNVNGSSFIGIDTITIPVLTGGKSNPMQGLVKKIVTGSSVMVFQNKNANGYENMINKRLIQEGMEPTFVVGPRTWGDRIPNSPFITHKDKLYLEVIFLKAGKVTYTLNDKPINKEYIMGLKESSEANQEGLDNKVIIRTYAADSITKVRIDGQEFNLTVDNH